MLDGLPDEAFDPTTRRRGAHGHRGAQARAGRSRGVVRRRVAGHRRASCSTRRTSRRGGRWSASGPRPSCGPGRPAAGSRVLPATQRARRARLPTAAGLGEPTVSWDGQTRGDTCHIDVVDRWGNIISATPSGGWLQSSPTIPELGFCLGSRLQMCWLDEGLPASLAPGRRPRTTLSPTLVLRDGRPVLACGTPGGDQQDQWQLPFLLHHLVRRPRPPGGDRGAVVPHHLGPELLLPAGDEPRRAGRRGPPRRRTCSPRSRRAATGWCAPGTGPSAGCPPWAGTRTPVCCPRRRPLVAPRGTPSGVRTARCSARRSTGSSRARSRAAPDRHRSRRRRAGRGSSPSPGRRAHLLRGHAGLAERQRGDPVGVGEVELEQPDLLARPRGEVQPVRRLADPDLHRPRRRGPRPRTASGTARSPPPGRRSQVPIQRASRSGSVTAAQTSSMGARNSRVWTSTCCPSRCSIRCRWVVLMRSPPAGVAVRLRAPLAAGPVDLGLQGVQGLLADRRRGRPARRRTTPPGPAPYGPARSSARGPGRSPSRRPPRAAAAGAC